MHWWTELESETQKVEIHYPDETPATEMARLAEGYASGDQAFKAKHCKQFPWFGLLCDEDGPQAIHVHVGPPDQRPAWHVEAILAVIEALERGEVRSIEDVRPLIESVEGAAESELQAIYAVLIDAYLGEADA